MNKYSDLDRTTLFLEKSLIFSKIGIEVYNTILFRDYTEYEITKKLKEMILKYKKEIDQINESITGDK